MAVKSQGDGYQFTGDEADLHHTLGLGLFICIVLQAIGSVFICLGYLFASADSASLGFNRGFVASTRRTNVKREHGAGRAQMLGKSWSRWLHIIAGITLMGLLITYVILHFHVSVNFKQSRLD